MIGRSLVEFSTDIAHGNAMIERTLEEKYIQGIETVHINREGNKMFIESNAALINFKGEKAILAINRNVTAKKEAEEKIKASLKEKEVLLKEIHHRVKNNLQVISSLLKLQSDYITDKSDFELFRESQNRVKTMALIHEKLYRSNNLSRIDFHEYVNNLTSSLLSTYGVNKEEITLVNKSEKVHFDIDTAIPCGLIINELVSNSLKHAFPDSLRGEITVDLKKQVDKKYMLTIGDNGSGFPDNTDFRNTKSLGLQLVITLVEQLDASIELIKDKGTTFKIIFSEMNYKIK